MDSTPPRRDPTDDPSISDAETALGSPDDLLGPDAETALGSPDAETAVGSPDDPEASPGGGQARSLRLTRHHAGSRFDPEPRPEFGAAHESGASRRDRASGESGRHGSHGSHGGTSSDDSTQLLPGRLIGGRYRIVARLGSGGMGTVYRADDLKLGQPVALKFLAPRLERDADRVRAFRDEVRLAREVTHPNVCRVHDIDEVDGHIFLSMEYIDGEDLASLLRRIGRVPNDKAIELARQICSGLSAAHDKGVLHRDLKPGNIMIDGRGRARLTDFGLAALSGTVSGHDLRSGTPVYMAPEQLEGREVSVRSDLYALGLVLYELFTGRRAFDAKTLDELRTEREVSNVTLPSTHVTDVDPAVERVILRCLDPDPQGRPTSAAAVSAALPGGDPLAAALAAGETPSPELIAAAGPQGGMTPRAAWSWLSAALVSLALIVALAPQTTSIGADPPPKPPEVLQERARQILADLGHRLVVADHDAGFGVRNSGRQWAEEERTKRGVNPQLPPQATGFRYYYRQASEPFNPFNTYGSVLPNDPPPTQPGMALVWLSARGDLQGLSVIPPQLEPESAPPAPAPDWNPLLLATGFDPASLTPVPPRLAHLAQNDARAAWTVPIAGSADAVVRIEAAAYRGIPNSLSVIFPWDRVAQGISEREAIPSSMRIVVAIAAFSLLGALLVAAMFARRNLLSGRGDRRGAFRIAIGIFLSAFAALLLGVSPPREIAEGVGRIIDASGPALVVAGIVWLLYLALEPIVRRTGPHYVVSWSRLLAGQWRDPLVGRDLLIGATLGLGIIACSMLVRWVPPQLGFGAPPPLQMATSVLDGSRFAIANILGAVASALGQAMLMMFFVVLGTKEPRLRWIGYTIFFGISLLMFWLSAGPPPWPAAPLIVGAALLYSLAFARFGLVAGCAMMLYIQWRFPLVVDPSTWFVGISVFGMLLLAALPLLGFRLALGGRRAFAREG